MLIKIFKLMHNHLKRSCWCNTCHFGHNRGTATWQMSIMLTKKSSFYIIYFCCILGEKDFAKQKNQHRLFLKSFNNHIRIFLSKIIISWLLITWMHYTITTTKQASQPASQPNKHRWWWQWQQQESQGGINNKELTKSRSWV